MPLVELAWKPTPYAPTQGVLERRELREILHGSNGSSARLMARS